MKSSVFSKEGVGLSAPMGKPFVPPGCVVGLNIVSMQPMLQALVRLQTHSCSIWACWQTEAAFCGGRPSTSKKVGLQHFKWDLPDFIFHGGRCLQGFFEASPLSFALNVMTVGISSDGWIRVGKEASSQSFVEL